MTITTFILGSIDVRYLFTSEWALHACRYTTSLAELSDIATISECDGTVSMCHSETPDSRAKQCLLRVSLSGILVAGSHLLFNVVAILCSLCRVGQYQRTGGTLHRPVSSRPSCLPMASLASL